ncbi:threonine ammonia-lyase [Derxia lacustris]|uniref:threonine ammonia-lyase n=1 Tax=Derxia lacustris TaxID=764842 RepID=UPI000A171F83|nr:threonine ammonia-lyase [Derxia lacustris]
MSAPDVAAVGLDVVRAAAALLDGQIVRTPCLHSRTLSRIVGAEVWLKFENLQFTGAFKERGALVKLASLTGEERARGVIAASAGNHAQGVAYHAQRLGIPATIVMPVYAPQVKVDGTREFGAEVVLAGENFDAARDTANAIAAERGLVFVHPYDDAAVIAGQGTIALEMLDAVPALDTLVVPIGGGGLIGGMAGVARALNPAIEVFGVQAARFPSMWALRHGQSATYGDASIADGIAVKSPGVITRELVARHVRDVLLVDEGDIEQAIVMLLEIEKTVVEGAGAVGLACLLRHRERFAGRRVGLVLCGGNIDPRLLADLIERGLARSGRLARIVVAVRDVPGGLATVARRVAELGANIEQIEHRRIFSALPAQTAEVELVLRTRDAAHVAELRRALEAAGFGLRPE